MFWAKLSGHCSPAGIVKSVNVNTNTVTLCMRAAGVACHKYLSTCDVKFSRLAVDKTYFGKRKYNRGKRTRSKGYWLVTATKLNIDGSTGRTVWKLMKRRDRQTLQPFVESLVLSSRSVVVSDCHKGYANLSQVVRHFTVNHSIGFKNLETGKHTNKAEGCHSVIKRWIGAQCYMFGQDSATLQCNVAIQCIKHGDCKLADNAQGANLLKAHTIMRRTTTQI